MLRTDFYRKFLPNLVAASRFAKFEKSTFVLAGAQLRLSPRLYRQGEQDPLQELCASRPPGTDPGVSSPIFPGF